MGEEESTRDLMRLIAWFEVDEVVSESAGALGRRYTGPVAESGGLVGRVVRSPLQATGCVVAYVAVIGAALMAVQFHLKADLANVVLLTVGGMHVFFDGFIWKLRRPVVARSVAAA